MFAAGPTRPWPRSPRRVGEPSIRTATFLAASKQNTPRTCVTDEGRSLEELLRSGLDGAADFVGAYRTTTEKTVVGPTKELGKPPFLAELPEGTVIDVVEVVSVPGDQRLRGRIESPVAGWVSLLNTKTGFRWAERQGPEELPLALFDDGMDKVRQMLCEEAGIGCEVSGSLSGELQDRLRSDVLYLSVVRKYDEEGLPLLPTFEGPAKKTWAMSGEGLEQWQSMAEDHAHQVPLSPVQNQLLDHFKRIILNGRQEYNAVFDAYEHQFIRRAVWEQVEGSAASFEPFLKAFGEKKKEVLMSVGGAGGLPTRNRTASGTGGGRDPESAEEMMEWIAFFAMLQENTRMSQADAYFGHALFGLCLRRLIQRFELERSMGMLPELSEDVMARVRLETSASKEAGEAALASAQFAAFAERVGQPDSDALSMVLSISSSTLGALRRQTEYVFGRGLRDELAKPMDRAMDELEDEVSDAMPLEALASLMLEAASCGELRMLSTSPESRERLAWDGMLYGALLQGADEATPQP